jgi:hypothetical protein
MDDPQKLSYAEDSSRRLCMKAFGCFAWLLLFLLCWPVALVALVLYPLVLIISLFASLLGFSTDKLLNLYRGVIKLPIDANRSKK